MKDEMKAFYDREAADEWEECVAILSLMWRYILIYIDEFLPLLQIPWVKFSTECKVVHSPHHNNSYNNSSIYTSKDNWRILII